eukprot:7655033-Alexandrium_andersonii.AAC.1
MARRGRLGNTIRGENPDDPQKRPPAPHPQRRYQLPPALGGKGWKAHSHPHRARQGVHRPRPPPWA